MCIGVITSYIISYCNFRVLEAILIAMVTTSSVFTVAMLLGTCLPDANKADIVNNNNSCNCAYVRHVKHWQAIAS